MSSISFIRTHLTLIIAASAAFSLSTLFSSVKPVLLTQFMRELSFEASLSGLIVASPFVGISLSTFVVAWLISRYSYLSVISAAGLILTFSQLGNSIWFEHVPITLLFQLSSGICIGVLMGTSSSYIAQTKSAGALFGLVDTIGVLLMSVMLIGVSTSTESYGLQGGFLFSALLAALFWMLMYAYRCNKQTYKAKDQTRQPFELSLRPVVIIIMGVLFITFSGQGFAFMFTIASNLGMSYEQAGNNIGIILFISAFACLAGGICSHRFGAEKSLAGGFVVCAIGWTVAINSESQSMFLLGLFPAICTLQFCFPVLLSLASTLDDKGRWAAITAPLLTSGFAWAAILAGTVVEFSGISSLVITTQVGMFVCCLLLGLSMWLKPNKNDLKAVVLSS